jgi:hypothetical protein
MISGPNDKWSKKAFEDIWKNVDLKFEGVHFIMCGILYFLIF